MKHVEVMGQPAIALRAPDGAQATVLLHGAHIVSWTPAGGQEQLYLSPRSAAGDGKAVRGGVPVIFPQFSARGPLPRHGFARTRAWSLVQSDTGPSHALAVLRLQDDEATRAIWPQAFAAELTVSIAGRQLDIELAVHNTGDTPFEFSAALHTYLRCDDIDLLRLSGLHGHNYEDSVRAAPGRQEIEPLTVVGEIDRIYWDVSRPVRVDSPGRHVVISADGFPDAVVWNPGPQKCAALADMPPDGWREMMCVEAAAIGDPVRLAPGQEWAGRQTLEASGR